MVFDFILWYGVERSKMLFLLSTLLLSLLSLANAQLGAPVPTNLPSAPSSSSGNGSAIFVYNGDDNTQFIFALNADKSSGGRQDHDKTPQPRRSLT